MLFGVQTKLLTTTHSKPFEPNKIDTNIETRFLPKNYMFKSFFHIFPDKILISTYNNPSPAIVIDIIDMKDIFNVVFEMLWKNAEKNN